MRSCRYRRLQRLRVALLIICLPLFSCAARGALVSSPCDPEPKIATDPAFRELVGGLIEGIPAFPPYPGATLIGSAERNRPNEKNRGYRIKWTTAHTPAMVIAWYEKTLLRQGWAYVPPDEPDEEDELEAKIAKGVFRGYLEAEVEDGITEIIVVLARK